MGARYDILACPNHSGRKIDELTIRERSVWIFLLLGMEAIRTYKTNPYLVIGTHQVPTWTTPLVMALVVSALVPNTSLLGHLCGLAIGYLCKLRAATRPFYAERRGTANANHHLRSRIGLPEVPGPS